VRKLVLGQGLSLQDQSITSRRGTVALLRSAGFSVAGLDPHTRRPLASASAGVSAGASAGEAGTGEALLAGGAAGSPPASGDAVMALQLLAPHDHRHRHDHALRYSGTSSTTTTITSSTTVGSLSPAVAAAVQQALNASRAVDGYPGAAFMAGAFADFRSAFLARAAAAAAVKASAASGAAALTAATAKAAAGAALGAAPGAAESSGVGWEACCALHPAPLDPFALPVELLEGPELALAQALAFDPLAAAGASGSQDSASLAQLAPRVPLGPGHDHLTATRAQFIEGVTKVARSSLLVSSQGPWLALCLWGAPGLVTVDFTPEGTHDRNVHLGRLCGWATNGSLVKVAVRQPDPPPPRARNSSSSEGASGSANALELPPPPPHLPIVDRAAACAVALLDTTYLRSPAAAAAALSLTSSSATSDFAITSAITAKAVRRAKLNSACGALEDELNPALLCSERSLSKPPGSTAGRKGCVGG